MKRKIYFKILLVLAALVLLIKLSLTVFIEPWVWEKIKTAVNEKNSNYVVEIAKVHISIITSAIELDSITIHSKKVHTNNGNLNGEIGFIKFKGIHLMKAIFKKDIWVRRVIISNSSFNGNIQSSRRVKAPILSPLNIRIGSILFDKTNLSMRNALTTQHFSLKNGIMKVYDLHIDKQDTISSGIVRRFDFKAERLISVSPDSMYSFTAGGINYSSTSNILAVNNFNIQPNYTDYDFTSRYEFQKSRFEAGLNNIHVHDFSCAGYLRTGSLVSSYIEIGKMDMKVFRDRRKEFRHVNKPAFQDLIYNFPGVIQIDSVCLKNGNVLFSVHAEKANEPGSISFNQINAKIYRITNNSIYKTKNAFFELRADALLMGKARMTILLKGKIFDSNNTFSVNGTLSALEANELNPILEKNAFIYATSGTIDAMDFSFTANNSKATGKMTMLYHGLYIAVKNKQTDDTTAIKERLISLIANMKVLDSNPVPDKEVREGLIDYERDPERFLFHYCFQSILSGIKSSIVKNPKR